MATRIQVETLNGLINDVLATRTCVRTTRIADWCSDNELHDAAAAALIELDAEVRRIVGKLFSPLYQAYDNADLTAFGADVWDSFKGAKVFGTQSWDDAILAYAVLCEERDIMTVVRRAA